MYEYILLVSSIVVLSIFLCKALYRFGVPSLLVFIILGMTLGSDGLGGIAFDNFELASNLSSFALVYIMFFGGFGTKWSTARPAMVKAVLLSSVGTIITALVTALFAMLILGVSFPFGLLFGSVIASTDAASVFSILRSRKLNLKADLAPLLEVESGSNDPFAYLLTIVSISLVLSQGGGATIGYLLARQLAFGAAVGVGAAVLLVMIINKIDLAITGFYPLLLMAFVSASYAVCSLIGGNGFLCVYLIGIISGNQKIAHKLNLMRFFDAISWFMQMMLFLVLGLISFPSQLGDIALPSIAMALIIIFVSRPIAVFGILSWFRVPIKHQLFVSWVGLRGAASIVFAIIAISYVADVVEYDIFHSVFFVALLSITIQGGLLPSLARKLDLVEGDDNNSVLKTFNDYYEEVHDELMEHIVHSASPLAGKKILDAEIPDGILIVMIERGGSFITPRGSTDILVGDTLILNGKDFTFLESKGGAKAEG